MNNRVFGLAVHKKQSVSKLVCLLLFMVLLTGFLLYPEKKAEVSAFSPQVIQHGAVGEDVIELQARLKHIGFFTGEVDGVFGWRTYWALRHFQYEFGMEIDGVAGTTTKEKLAKATKYNEAATKEEMYGKKKSPNGKVQNQQNKNQQPQQQQQQQNQTTAVNIPHGFSQNDIKLMANAVHGEARGEPYEGQVAVASVILNRTKSDTFPNTVSGVIFEPRAFTAVADGQIWLTPNETAKRAVIDAINGWDPSSNALYYFNPDTATSPWIWTRPQIKKIGKHIFCN